MNNWNSTTNGNPTISGTYTVTVERGRFQNRYVTRAEYMTDRWGGGENWFFVYGPYEDPQPIDELGCKVVAWQPMPEAYMGE